MPTVWGSSKEKGLKKNQTCSMESNPSAVGIVANRLEINPKKWRGRDFKCSVGRTDVVRVQVASQPAMEAIPLVMEPESRLYNDPVIVLDFQSLYPSIVIAYNLCYSTLLGRPSHASGDGSTKLGAFSASLPAGTLSGCLAPDK